jgi:hypothetical protein
MLRNGSTLPRVGATRKKKKDIYLSVFPSVRPSVDPSTYLPTYLPTHISIYPSMALQFFVSPWSLFNLFIVYTDGRTLWMSDQPVARPLPAHTGQHKHRINAYWLSCLNWDSNPRSQCVCGKTVHALDCANTVIFYTTALNRYQWSASCTGFFTPLCSLDRKMVGPQNRSGGYGEEKNCLPLPGNKPRRSSL